MVLNKIVISKIVIILIVIRIIMDQKIKIQIKYHPIFIQYSPASREDSSFYKIRRELRKVGKPIKRVV